MAVTFMGKDIDYVSGMEFQLSGPTLSVCQNIPVKV